MDAPRDEKGARNGCTEEEEVSLGRDESCRGMRGIAPRSERDGAAGERGAPRNTVACEMVAPRKKKQPEGVWNHTNEREG